MLLFIVAECHVFLAYVSMTGSSICKQISLIDKGFVRKIENLGPIETIRAYFSWSFSCQAWVRSLSFSAFCCIDCPPSDLQLSLQLIDGDCDDLHTLIADQLVKHNFRRWSHQFARRDNWMQEFFFNRLRETVRYECILFGTTISRQQRNFFVIDRTSSLFQIKVIYK